MKKATLNTFHEGINFDLNDISAPNNILTDCLNGTLITFNGNEYTLQNDFGNAIVETTKLKPGFIPIGLVSYGGIIYVVSHNPMTNKSEFGSFPSPERNIDPDNFISLDPTSGIEGLKEQVITDLSFYDSNNKIVQTIKRDLMNIDNFKLSSGDKFAVYIVDRSTATNLLSNIGKLFDFKVANINDGSLSYLESFDLFDKSEIAFNETVSGNPIKYNVYSESSIGKLAVILKLKNIDYFNLTVRETTNVKNITKKTVLINAQSGTSCDIKCKGFKLNIYKPSVNNMLIYTKYIYSETGNINDVYFQLTGFDENEEYLFEAIPYTQFQLYDSEDFIQFKKKQSIVIGKDNSGVPSGETYYTDLYKYYSGENYIMIDFNLKMRTSGQIQKSYIELYDPYADVSTIKEISNFNLYGQNTIRIEAVNETIKDDDFGGIDPSNVGIFSDSSGVQVLLSKDRRYRRDGMVRLNHFYIIRICLVEVNQNEDGTSITDYHDLYKTIITDTLLNSKYNDNSVLNYDSLNRTLADPIYKKNEKFSTTESILNEVYLNDFTTVNDNSMMYNIINNASGKDKSTFGYKTSQEEKYLEEISYDFDFNNSIIGKLNENSISISDYGLNTPNFQIIQTPLVSNSGYSETLNSLRTTQFGFDSNSYSVNRQYLSPSIKMNLKSTVSRVAYGEGNKELKTKDGFRKIYISNKLSSSVANKMADMEFGGIARWQGTGKYSGQSGNDTENSELLIRRGIHPAIHSDNFNIHLKVNTDLREGTWGTHWYDTTNGNGNSNGVVAGTTALGWPQWQSFIGKYINIKGANPEEAYSSYNNGAITSLVNKQKYVYIFPGGDANGPDGYVVLPIAASSIDDLSKKILKLTNSIFYAIPSSGSYSIYYISNNNYSYDLQYQTKFLFDSFGFRCNLNRVPVFKFRFKNNNLFETLDLSSEVVNTWMINNVTTTGRHIVNLNFTNILSTPYFSQKEFNLESPKVEINTNIILNNNVIEKFSSSKEDLDRDPVWIDEKDIKSDEINTSLKQYDPILKYFKFDKTTESFYYSADFQWAYSSNCKYSYNGDGPSNNRRTVGMGISLSTANFDL